MIDNRCCFNELREMLQFEEIFTLSIIYMHICVLLLTRNSEWVVLPTCSELLYRICHYEQYHLQRLRFPIRSAARWLATVMITTILKYKNHHSIAMYNRLARVVLLSCSSVVYIYVIFYSFVHSCAFHRWRFFPHDTFLTINQTSTTLHGYCKQHCQLFVQFF